MEVSWPPLISFTSSASVLRFSFRLTLPLPSPVCVPWCPSSPVTPASKAVSYEFSLPPSALPPMPPLPPYFPVFPGGADCFPPSFPALPAASDPISAATAPLSISPRRRFLLILLAPRGTPPLYLRLVFPSAGPLSPFSVPYRSSHLFLSFTPPLFSACVYPDPIAPPLPPSIFPDRLPPLPPSHRILNMLVPPCSLLPQPQLPISLIGTKMLAPRRAVMRWYGILRTGLCCA